MKLAALLSAQPQFHCTALPEPGWVVLVSPDRRPGRPTSLCVGTEQRGFPSWLKSWAG